MQASFPLDFIVTRNQRSPPVDLTFFVPLQSRGSYLSPIDRCHPGRPLVPFLRVEQGSCPGQLLEVSGERTVIGRHPGCEIVLDNAAVSRQHAQISESHGCYYLRDLRSRNQTFLNGRLMEGSSELRDGDAIQFCDLSFRFYLAIPEGELAGDDLRLNSDSEILESLTGSIPSKTPIVEGPSATDSSIIGTVSVDDARRERLAIQSEQKLRAVLNIGRSLGHALELRDVLENTLTGLFEVFPHADHGFVLFQKGDRLDIEAARARQPTDQPPHVSSTIVRRATETGEAILSANLGGDPRFSESESISSMSLRSVMCVPLYAQSSEPVGVLQLDSLNVERPFNKEDLDLLASLAGQIGLAVENARLHTELVTQRDIQRELDFAMQVQIGFLPSHPPDVPGFAFFDHYEAAQRVGGDYFDYVELPDGRVAVTVGDVAGKGVPAALLMARLFASARYQLLTRGTPGDALAALNNELAQTALGHRFITCLFMMIDPARATMTIANAGHMAPLIRSADGKIISLGQKESGVPVGIAREQEFTEVKQELQPGDLVLMYTDGVTEAMNREGDLYGRGRLVSVLGQCPDDIQETIESIVADVDRFSGDLPQRDDICLVGFRYLS